MGFLLEVRRGVSVLEQARHLGAPPEDPLQGAIQWRLLFPALARGADLSAPALFGLAHLGAVLVLGALIGELRRRGAAWSRTGLIALLFGAAAWYFASVCWLGYFDAWVVLGLLVVTFARARAWVWAACLLTPWIDERFVLGWPLAMACRAFVGAGREPAPLADWKREWLGPAALMAGFLVVRLGWLGPASGKMASVGGYLAWLDLSAVPWTRFVLGIWEGWRVGWVLVGAAFWWATSPRERAVLGAGLLGVLLVGLLTAQDFSRSMMLAAPVVAVGAVRLASATEPWWPRRLALLAAAAVLLPGQLVMSDAVVPVMTLNHELANWRSPPARVMPEVYELRGVHAMEQGELAQAELHLTMAIKLADHPASAYKHRGLLYAGAQRWPQALADFVQMTAHAPADPDGWLLRAQARAALGDLAAARADWQQAMRLAPPDWLHRPDVARFQQRLYPAAAKP